MAAYRSGYDSEKGDLLSQSIRKMKRGAGQQLAAAFADALANLLLGTEELPVAVDMIVPVPSDQWRLERRGYSIAAIMSEVISARMALPTCPKVLETVGEVPELRSIARGQRMRSIAGKYRVTQPEYVDGRNILIVDDVITSGATIKTIAAELKRHGAMTVSVIAIAHSESSH
jgi:predicted amidophosphoribosyltransferase